MVLVLKCRVCSVTAMGLFLWGKSESGGNTDSSSVHVSILMITGAWCTQGGACEMGCLEGFLQMGNWLCMCSSDVQICWHLVLHMVMQRAGCFKSFAKYRE